MNVCAANEERKRGPAFGIEVQAENFKFSK